MYAFVLVHRELEFFRVSYGNSYIVTAPRDANVGRIMSTATVLHARNRFGTG